MKCLATKFRWNRAVEKKIKARKLPEKNNLRYVRKTNKKESTHKQRRVIRILVDVDIDLLVGAVRASAEGSLGCHMAAMRRSRQTRTGTTGTPAATSGRRGPTARSHTARPAHGRHGRGRGRRGGVIGTAAASAVEVRPHPSLKEGGGLWFAVQCLKSLDGKMRAIHVIGLYILLVF